MLVTCSADAAPDGPNDRVGLRRGVDTMPNLGAPELIIIAIVVIALFGWKKLPDMARSLGRSARVFKSEVDELKKDGKPTPASEASQSTVPGEAYDADAERRAADARLADAERRAAEARAEADRLRAASSSTGTPGAASTPDATSDVRRDTTL
jgi:sec-independent protein translocase protein TatA